MFKKNKELRWLVLGALLLSAFGLVASLVAMNTALSIKEANQFWKVDIMDVDVETTGQTSASTAEITSTNLSNIDVTFNGKGTAVYKFRIRNSGDVDASLKVINIGRALCNYDKGCDGVSYKLTYNDGREVFTGDVINSDTNMLMQLVIEYNGNNTGLKLDDLDFILLYEQA